MTLSGEVTIQIVSLAQQTSKNQCQIASELGILRCSVQQPLKVFNETGSVEEHEPENRGRKSKLSDREKSILVRESKKNPKSSAKEVRKSAGPSYENISVRTVQRVLVESVGLAYRPQKVPQLTNHQKRRRYEWSRTHITYSEDDWQEVNENEYF